MSSTTHKKAKRGRSQSKASVETAVAKAMEEKKNKVPAKYADFGLSPKFYQAWEGAGPYPQVIYATSVLSTIARGNESYQRGAGAKKILIKGIQVRGWARMYAGSTDPSACALFSLVIVYDKDPVGSTAAVLSDFLASNAGTDAGNNSLNVALNNDGTAQRFQVLRRMDVCLNNYNDGGVVIDTYIKGNKRPIIYRNIGTGEIGDIQTGAVYAFLLQQSRFSWGAAAASVDASPRVLADINYRVRFHEVI